jgi:hypothetical protein
MDGPLINRRGVMLVGLAAAAGAVLAESHDPTCVKLPPCDSMIVDPETNTYRVGCHGKLTPPLTFHATAEELRDALQEAFGVPFHVRQGEHGAEVVSGTAEDPRPTIPAPPAGASITYDGLHRIDLGAPSEIRFLERHRGDCVTR